MYEVLLHNEAVKFYNKLDDKSTSRINSAIDVLRENPVSGKDIKLLKGELKGKFRLRVGKYRIIYRVENDKNTVIIEHIGLRGKVY